jgi:hypothetical protein
MDHSQWVDSPSKSPIHGHFFNLYLFPKEDFGRFWKVRTFCSRCNPLHMRAESKGLTVNDLLRENHDDRFEKLPAISHQ